MADIERRIESPHVETLKLVRELQAEQKAQRKLIDEILATLKTMGGKRE